MQRLLQSRLVWALLSNGLRVGGYVLILPIALKTIPEAEMEIWWLFVAVQALVIQADFGIGPSISRGLAYLLTGATSLQPGAAQPDAVADPDRIAGFLQACHRVYRWVLLAAFLILIPASFFIVPKMGAGTFSRGSFGQAPAPTAADFVAEVRAGETPVARWLRGELPESVLTGLTPAATNDRPVWDRHVRDLVKALNRVAEQGRIDVDGRFDGIELRPETRRLLAEATTGVSVTRAHRLLLEDAFPRTLVRDTTVLHGAEWRRMVAGWFVFAFGVLLTLSTTRFINFLTGSDHVRLAQQIAMAGMAANLILTAAGLLAGLGFVALALGSVGNGVAQAILGRRAVRRFLAPYLHAGDAVAGRRIFWELWPTAWRAGLVSLGAYLIYNSNVFWASEKLGQPEASQYPFTLKLMQVLMVVCGLPVTTQVPRLARWMAAGETGQAWRFFLRRHLLGLAALTTGIAGLLLLYGSQSTLLPGPALLFMGLIYLLELNHSQFAALIMTSNRVPFVWAATVSGGAICLGSGLFAGSFGLWGLLGTVFVVQAAWNNWWVPWWAWKSVRR